MMKIEQKLEELSLEFGFKPDKYYTAKEKMFKESLKGSAPTGRF